MVMKSALITGASAGGIGAALALEFQRRGVHVFATARSISKVAYLKDVPNVTVFTLDVTDPSSVAEAVRTVRATVAKTNGNGLDILVNNSGRGYVSPLLDADLEEGKRMFDVNFWAVLAVTQAFAPLLIEAKGSVVNISSISSCLNDPYRGIYGASKAAVTIAGETLRLEMAPLGVRVVTAITGVVATKFGDNLPDFKLPSSSVYLPIKKEVEDVANSSTLPSAMDVDVYARKIADDVMGGVNGLIYRGKLATAARYMSKWFPAFLLDYILIGSGGLDKLAGRMKYN